MMNMEQHLAVSREKAGILKTRRDGAPIAMMTAYDYPTARLLDEAGADALLVGDSLGMMVMGYPDTTHVVLADMIHHCRLVARSEAAAFMIGDLPINTYRTDEEALRNSLALMETGVHAVKLEGGVELASRVAFLVGQGIPVVGHIGLLPQRVLEEGGYHIKGKTDEEAAQLEKDVLAIAGAGACMIVVEGVSPRVARRLTEISPVPTIGIGSGKDSCNGAVVVISDLVGAFPWFVPGFIKPRADVAGVIRETARGWINEIRESRSFLTNC